MGVGSGGKKRKVYRPQTYNSSGIRTSARSSRKLVLTGTQVGHPSGSTGSRLNNTNPPNGAETSTSVYRVTEFVTSTDGRVKSLASSVVLPINEQDKPAGNSYALDNTVMAADDDDCFSEGEDDEDTGELEDVEDDDWESLLDSAYLEYLDTLVLKPSKAKRNRPPGDESLQSWRTEQNAFLHALIGLEGRRSGYQDECRCSCTTPSSSATQELPKVDGPHLESTGDMYECIDCIGRQLKCCQCMVSHHQGLPLHRVKRWNGRFFEKSSLKELGLRIQLGHQIGQLCPKPERCYDDDFIIIDNSGIHSVGVNFCRCGHTASTRVHQLLEVHLYPASVREPKTAVTLNALKHFELLSYCSKVSAFEFYTALARLTDNVGIHVPKDRYPPFLRVTRQWRFLEMMKWAGRGHEAGGIEATPPGECGLLCPACPHPGKNLPEGWENAPDYARYLYALFIAIDGNFRLKRKQVSNEAADPGLLDGLAYFVKESLYHDYLSNYKDETEPKSTCSRHDAVLLSEAKPGRGHAATGVVTVECSRHDMKRPNAIGDLQRGERYCNVDYIFRESLRNTTLKTIVTSYDIACQWSINLFDRIQSAEPDSNLLSDSLSTMFLIPKFHLPAHIEKCRTRFSFNYIPGVGRTDGEAPERGWADTNPLASSTREMGPGSRRDTLDFHFGDRNWVKITGLGLSLAQRLWSSAIDMAEHTILHNDYEKSLSTECMAEWRQVIEAWEVNPHAAENPLEINRKGPCLNAVRLRLSEEEKQQLARNQDFSLDIVVTPSVLISTGLDLEKEQRTTGTTNSQLWEFSLERQRAQTQLRNNSLQRKINTWIGYQERYMPNVTFLRQKQEEEATKQSLPELKPHEIPLWLPSQLGKAIPHDHRFDEIECKLRYAQAHEALENLRGALQTRAHLIRFKAKHVRGQGASTRARKVIDTVQSKINAAASEYRVAREALEILATMVDASVLDPTWWKVMQPLKDADIRELTIDEEHVSMGKQKISWIWRTMNEDENMESNPEYREAVRVQWCKSRARARTFQQEVCLLTAEMDRVLRFFEWQQDQWEERARKADKAYDGTPRSAAQVEALRGDALRQASIRSELSAHFKVLWKDLPAHVQEMQNAISDPEILEAFKIRELVDAGADGKWRRKRKRGQKKGHCQKTDELGNGGQTASEVL